MGNGGGHLEDTAPKSLVAHHDQLILPNRVVVLARDAQVPFVPVGNVADAFVFQELTDVSASRHGIFGNVVSVMARNAPDKHAPIGIALDCVAQDLFHETREPAACDAIRQLATRLGEQPQNTPCKHNVHAGLLLTQ